MFALRFKFGVDLIESFYDDYDELSACYKDRLRFYRRQIMGCEGFVSSQTYRAYFSKKKKNHF